MPNWKKLIVSGSDAALSSLTVTNEVTASYYTGSFTGSYKGDGSGLTGITVNSATTVEDTFTSQTSISISHNFGTKNIIVSVYNSDDEQIIPASIITTDNNTVDVTFAVSTSGRVVVVRGGHILSGSASTASLALELSNLATASYAINALTASHALNVPATASHALTAVTASHALNVPATASHALTAVTSSFAEVTTLSRGGSGSFSGSFEGDGSGLLNIESSGGSGSFSGSFQGDGSELTGISISQATTIEDVFTSQTSITVEHNFGTKNVLVSVYNTDDEQIIPASIVTTDTNNVDITFAVSTSGRAVVAKGGHIVSGSIVSASFATFSDSASVAVRATTLSPDATASIADFATTASQADNATTASIADLASTLSNTATASFADSATTASQADNATSASFAVTASYALNAAAGGGGGGVGATNEQTISVDLHVSQSENLMLLQPFEVSDGTTITVENDAILFTEDFSVPALVDSASFAETASFYGGSVTSASLAETASFVETAQTASYALVASQSVNNNTASGSLSFWQGSQAEYDLISASADNNTVYFVVE